MHPTYHRTPFSMKPTLAADHQAPLAVKPMPLASSTLATMPPSSIAHPSPRTRLAHTPLDSSHHATSGREAHPLGVTSSHHATIEVVSANGARATT